MKKTRLIMVFTLFAIVSSVECRAQSGPGRPQLPVPRPGLHRQALQQVNAYNGQVGEWTTNDDYVYDGFYLQTSQGRYLVKFAPHIGHQFTQAIKKGNTITINGVEEINLEGEREIRMINVIANGTTIFDVPPVIGLDPIAETQVNGKGKITAFQKNREGEINGYIVDEKTMLRIPPHVLMQLYALISKGASVAYSGVKKSLANGEVSNGNYTIIHCQTITVNGTEYLIR